MERKVSTRRLVISVIMLVPLIFVWAHFLSGNYRSFKVISGSMIPTLNIGDYVVMTRAEGSSSDLLNHTIVFKDPDNKGELLTKRVVAGSGDTVRLLNGHLYVNNSREPLWHPKIKHVNDRTWVVGRHEVFVVGDNRNNSYDSIDYGPISTDLILGEVKMRYWPISRVGTVK